MKVKLGDLTKIKTGKLDANASSTDGKYPFFTCSKETLKIDNYSYDCECVLVAGNGDLNVKYYNGKFDAYQRTYIIEDNGSGKLYMPYLYFFMEKYVEELRKMSIGGVIKYIKLGNLTDAEIELPEIDKQKEIVYKLSKIKAIIDNEIRHQDLLDELVKARFVELFKDKGFELVPLSQLANNRVSTTKKDFDSEDVIKYIDISSIDNSKNQMTGFTEYVVKDAPSRAQQHIKKNDIVISTVRPNLRNVAITSYEDDNLIASSGFCVLRAKKDVCPEYLLAIACSDDFTNKMTEVTTGANYPAIHDSDVMSYLVENAPYEKQKEFAEFVKQIDKSKSECNAKIKLYQELLDKMMDYYFGDGEHPELEKIK